MCAIEESSGNGDTSLTGGVKVLVKKGKVNALDIKDDFWIDVDDDKVDYWRNSNQKQRWLATALLDIEPRLNRIRGYKYLLE